MNANQKTGSASTEMQKGSQMRITDADVKLIKSAFKNNEPLLLLMRKIFLPEIDPNAPIGQVIDLWMTVDVKDMSAEEALVNIKARNQLITHLDQQLMTLSIIANKPEESEVDLEERKKKNGTR